MKIISRGVGEQIAINDHTTVTILEIDAEKVILSVCSLEPTPTYREEIILLNKNEPASRLQTMTR